MTKERHGLVVIEASGLSAVKADRVSSVPSVPAFGHLLSCTQSGLWGSANPSRVHTIICGKAVAAAGVSPRAD